VKIQLIAILYLVLATATSLLSQDHSTEKSERKIDMWEEPRHQLVFSKDQLKVMDVRIAPNDTSQYHQHRFATIYIVINDALMWGQAYGQDWKASRTIRRDKYTIADQSMAYFKNHTYHRVCNPDTTTMHLIAILNMKEPTDEVFANQEGVNNRWFRESRLKLDAGKRSELLTFTYPTVMVQCKAGESAVLQDEVVHSIKTEGGAFSWHEANVPFTVINESENSQEFVLIEIK